MVQNSKIIVHCSTEEKDRIKRNADKVGLTIRQYILYVSLNTEVRLEVKSRDIEPGKKFPYSL